MKAPVQDEAFGIIPVYKDEEGKHFFCLIQHYHKHWGFPKGHKDDGETDMETAMRELREEAGIREVELVKDKVWVESYVFEREGITYDKTVTYFIGFVESIDTHTEDAFKNEITEMKWATYGEALELLTFPEMQKLCKEVHSFVSSL